MLIEIWAEGHKATGSESNAQLLGKVEADNFIEAIIRLVAKEGPEFARLVRVKKTARYCHIYYWGCRLYDNEKDARKSFN